MSVRILLSDVGLLVRFYARSTLSLLLIEYRVTYCASGNWVISLLNTIVLEVSL